MTDEFLDSAREEWHETASGSYVRIGNGEITATVFEQSDGWGGARNIFESPCFTRRRRDTPEAAAELLLAAEGKGENSLLWAPPSSTDWQPSIPKNGLPGFWRKRPGGGILAVRQCQPRGGYPPSWLAYLGAGNQVLAADGRPWYGSAEEAMMAADAEYERRPQGR